MYTIYYLSTQTNFATQQHQENNIKQIYICNLINRINCYLVIDNKKSRNELSGWRIFVNLNI